MRRCSWRWRGRLLRVLRVPSGPEAMAALAEYALSTSRTGTEELTAITERHVSSRMSKIMESAATKLRRLGARTLDEVFAADPQQP